MSRLAKIYQGFFSTSLQRELAFRYNFIAKLLQNATWIGFFLLLNSAIFSQTQSVAGWTKQEVFCLVGCVFLVSGLFGFLCMSLWEIPEQIRKGTLDFVVTKPIDSQFFVSLRRLNFDRIGSILAGLGVIAWSASSASVQPGITEILAFATSIVCSCLIYYSFNLCLMAMSIFFVRIDNIWVLSETVLDAARFPTDIFPSNVRNTVLLVVPISLIASLPAKLIMGKEPVNAIWAPILCSIGFLLVSRWIWRWSLKHYTSASS